MSGLVIRVLNKPPGKPNLFGGENTQQTIKLLVKHFYVNFLDKLEPAVLY